MRKFSTGVATAALTCALTASSFAADLPNRKAPPIVPPPIFFSWTGCYVGANGGGLWVNKSWRDDNFNTANYGRGRATTQSNGGLIGGQIGCNYQINNTWVVGLQVDQDWSGATGSATDQIVNANTARARVESLGSATARVGLAWDRFLAYVKGGAAWESDRYNLDNGVLAYNSTRQSRNGATVGIGVEYAFTNNLSAFVEYDYYDFGTKGTTFRATCNLNNAGFCLDLFRIRENKNVVKVGVNWKFDFTTPQSAIVAKY